MSIDISLDGDCRVTCIPTGGRWNENCYVVKLNSTGEQIVIDPGDDSEAIIEAVIEGNQKPRYILLTHAHHDHLGGVDSLCRRFNINCFLYKADERLLRHDSMYAKAFAGVKIETPVFYETFESLIPIGR